MINVPAARAALTQAPGDHVVYSKDQAAILLAEVEAGQRARIALTNLTSVALVAARSAGCAA